MAAEIASPAAQFLEPDSTDASELLKRFEPGPTGMRSRAAQALADAVVDLVEAGDLEGARAAARALVQFVDALRVGGVLSQDKEGQNVG